MSVAWLSLLTGFAHGYWLVGWLVGLPVTSCVPVLVMSRRRSFVRWLSCCVCRLKLATPFDLFLSLSTAKYCECELLITARKYSITCPELSCVLLSVRPSSIQVYYYYYYLVHYTRKFLNMELGCMQHLQRRV